MEAGNAVTPREAEEGENTWTAPLLLTYSFEPSSNDILQIEEAL